MIKSVKCFWHIFVPVFDPSSSSISIINFGRAVPRRLLGRDIWDYCTVHTQRRHWNTGYYFGSTPTFFILLFVFLHCLFYLLPCLYFYAAQNVFCTACTWNTKNWQFMSLFEFKWPLRYTKILFHKKMSNPYLPCRINFIISLQPIRRHWQRGSEA